jgi:hypothetical protein
MHRQREELRLDLVQRSAGPFCGQKLSVESWDKKQLRLMARPSQHLPRQRVCRLAIFNHRNAVDQHVLHAF